MANQPVQPVRSIGKGSGAWVNEIWTDPVTSKVIRVTAYTTDQLNQMKTNIDTQYANNVKNVTDMLALLV